MVSSAASCCLQPPPSLPIRSGVIQRSPSQPPVCLRRQWLRKSSVQ